MYKPRLNIQKLIRRLNAKLYFWKNTAEGYADCAVGCRRGTPVGQASLYSGVKINSMVTYW